MGEDSNCSTQRTKQIKLSTKGLENAASLGINDFVLQIGSERIKCSRFEAAFLSPRITSILLADPTVEEYEIKVESVEKVNLDSLLSLSRNGSFEVSESNFEFLKGIAKSLGNQELCEALKQFNSEREELNTSNVCERLSLSRVLEVSACQEIDYLASHFYELDENLLKVMELKDLTEILRSDQLRILSEDSLLGFVLELGQGCFELLGCLHTEYLSPSAMSRLLESVSLEEVDTNLWKSLCRRLLLAVSVPVDQFTPTRFRVNEFPFDSSRQFDGIISHLTLECGENVHTHGIVLITASSNGSNACHQVVDYGWNNYWFSRSEPNSWIEFDFKDRRISPTHYTIKSGGESGCQLVNWSLDGSNDEISWTNLDRRSTKELVGKYIVKPYECKSVRGSTQFFRFIRLTQTSEDSSSNHYLLLANLEFFGKVITA
jgi:hypothetical protein